MSGGPQVGVQERKQGHPKAASAHLHRCWVTSLILPARVELYRAPEGVKGSIRDRDHISIYVGQLARTRA